MTIYGTMNPIGSTELPDLRDNAQNLDFFSLGSGNSYEDRLGQQRISLRGIEIQAAQAISSAGYVYTSPFNYASGIVISLPNQIFLKDGEYYKPAASLSLPYTTDGNWSSESSKFVGVGDAILRRDLSSAGGSQLLGGSVTVVASWQALGTLLSTLPGKLAQIYDTGANYFLDAADKTTAQNYPLVRVADDGGRWKMLIAGSVSARQFGAKGDGVTDDAPYIQSALNWAASVFGSVRLEGSHRVAAGITIPNGATLYSESSGEGFSGSTVTGGAEIVGDLSVPVIVTLDGGAASNSANFRNVLVRRAAGNIPSGSIGVKTIRTDNCILEDIVSRRSAITFSVEGQLAVTLENCNSFEATETHLQLKNVVEVSLINCRFGRNGGADIQSSSYCRITGAVDTVNFTRCQFNQSGNNVAGPILDLVSYNSPNGIITLLGCHAEAFTGALVRQTGPGSSPLQRLTVSSSQIHSEGGAGQELIQALTGGLVELNLNGNSSIVGKITLDQQPKFSVQGNFIHGQVTINQGSGSFSSNRLLSGLTVQGDFPEGSAVAVIGNVLCPSGPLVNNATGNVSVFGNLSGSQAANAQYVNVMSGGFLKLSDVGFAIRRLPGGSLSSDGTVTIPLSALGTGLDSRVLSISAFYRGSSGEAIPMVVAYADGSSLRLTGGIAGAKYRVSLILSSDPDSNWS